ncbi:MAG: hypothetical protein KKD17_04825 [Nanoarchaeota archaeon]|nr:hypothetical protein [Nanoarchaeota archaeon]
MEEKDIHRILSIISRRIAGKEIRWRLEGSANLRVQGMEVTVRDLDITTTPEGIDIFRSALNEYIVKDTKRDNLEGQSLVCDILGFEVEINSYGNDLLNMFEHVRIGSWNGLNVPLLPLENAKDFYRMIGRAEKVRLIQTHIEKNMKKRIK